MKKWKVWLFLVLAAAGGLFLYDAWVRATAADTYTVRMYRAETGLQSIVPREEAAWSEGSHDAEPVTVRFDGAVLKRMAGYGPTALHGSFAAAEVNALFGQDVLTADWPFSWSLYFTNDWYQCDAYMEVCLPDAPEGEVTATLTVYLRDQARPVQVLTWSGRVGERIKFTGTEL